MSTEVAETADVVPPSSRLPELEQVRGEVSPAARLAALLAVESTDSDEIETWRTRRLSRAMNVARTAVSAVASHIVDVTGKPVWPPQRRYVPVPGNPHGKDEARAVNVWWVRNKKPPR